MLLQMYTHEAVWHSVLSAILSCTISSCAMAQLCLIVMVACMQINNTMKGLWHVGPELGPLAGLMVGPEQGGWQVDEITVVSSRTGQIDRSDLGPPLCNIFVTASCSVLVLILLSLHFLAMLMHGL